MGFWARRNSTFRQCSVSVLENILNLASSPMNLTVLFLVSMLIWSFLRIWNEQESDLGSIPPETPGFRRWDLRGSGSLPSAWSTGLQPRQTCRGAELRPGESKTAAGPTWESGMSQCGAAAPPCGAAGEAYLCRGTVKSARTSFLRLALVFMFMQKSMAACGTDVRLYKLFLGRTAVLVCACPHLVYQVSVDAVGKLLDEGVHDQLQVGAGARLLVFLFCTQTAITALGDDGNVSVQVLCSLLGWYGLKIKPHSIWFPV